MMPRIFTICVCLGLLLLWACGRAEPEVNRNLPNDQPQIALPPAPNNSDPLANANLATPGASPLGTPLNANNASVVTELQDSRITSTNDNLGNRIEIREFRAHPRLSKVIVYSPVQGAKEARVYGNRGEVRPLPAKLIANALILSGDDLADAVGIATDKAPKKTAPPTPAPVGPPLPPLPKPTPSPKPTPAGEAKPSPTPDNFN